MVRVASVVDRGFEPRSGQTKDFASPLAGIIKVKAQILAGSE